MNLPTKCPACGKHSIHCTRGRWYAAATFACKGWYFEVRGTSLDESFCPSTLRAENAKLRGLLERALPKIKPSIEVKYAGAGMGNPTPVDATLIADIRAALATIAENATVQPNTKTNSPCSGVRAL